VPEKVVIVNTHHGETPEFIGKLVDFTISASIEPDIIEGYTNVNPLFFGKLAEFVIPVDPIHPAVWSSIGSSLT